MGAPSTRTLVKLELPPLRKSEAVPPLAPVRPKATAGGELQKLGQRDGLALIDFFPGDDRRWARWIAAARIGSACAVTRTLEERRSRFRRRSRVRDSPGERSSEIARGKRVAREMDDDSGPEEAKAVSAVGGRNGLPEFGAMRCAFQIGR